MSLKALQGYETLISKPSDQTSGAGQSPLHGNVVVMASEPVVPTAYLLAPGTYRCLPRRLRKRGMDIFLYFTFLLFLRMGNKKAPGIYHSVNGLSNHSIVRYSDKNRPLYIKRLSTHGSKHAYDFFLKRVAFLHFFQCLFTALK